jgi:hypothetical protein
MQSLKTLPFFTLVVHVLLSISPLVFLEKTALASSLPTLTRTPYIQWTTSQTAHVVWRARGATRLEYRPQQASKLADAKSWRQAVVGVSKDTGQHVARVAGLQPATIYMYRVLAGSRPLFNGTFATAKPQGQKFSFVAWGDSGTGSRAQKALANRLAVQKPDLLLHVGDLIYPRGEAKSFDPYFFDVYHPLLARVPFYGTPGNHDIMTRRGAPFFESLVLPTNGPASLTPERCFSFDYSDAHFVFLDSNAGEFTMERTIVPWLQRDDRASKRRWKIVVFHHPPFSSGLHGGDLRVQRKLLPTLRKLKFDLVLNGHDHHYERLRTDSGPLFLITGAGGGPLYPRRRQAPGSVTFINTVPSFTRVVIDGRTLHGRQIAVDGRILDSWTLKK